ncbi:MAG: 4-hydroxybenzoyl-CoA reductase subunit beta [Alphaproteobacteria bacterium]|jgi:4-hydroxybenzoyl-CoA reductase subunit beta|nr:4-hydroxybenzoyl-CoA reductase subunit beta [Alphaproteobacteria bacterium]MDP6563499.1 4-hydroxybenzoyl-CoA reductase subunit beta [Alphaproteobacteria bacterium]MDP6812685.1 4-hydroxybenzoyl-CoA reductase subunit beta [Alphaproteobacteria bacterium]
MEQLPQMRMHRPATAEEAVALHAEAAAARYLAGGSDLIVNVRRGIEQPEALIYLNGIGEMHEIAESDGGISMGGALTLRQLAENEILRRDYPAVAEAAGEVAGPSHREYGTLGGNLCLDTRCIYYNQSEWWRATNSYCLKHRGEICHVAPGGKKCFAAFSGDLAPALLLFDAEVELAGPDGRRRLPLAEMYRNDGLDHLTLAAGELLVAVHLPALPADVRSGYAKSRVRGSIDFPLAGAAVRLSVKDGALGDLRVALTGVGSWPFLVPGTEKFIGGPLDEETSAQLRELVRAKAKAMKTTTTAPHYRRRVAGVLAQRLAEGLATA